MKVRRSRISKNKVLSLAVLTLVAFIQFQSPNILFTNSENQEEQGENLTGTDFLLGEIQDPSSQAYLPNLTSSKSNVQVSLHQAYHSTSNISLSDTSTTFSLPAPNATEFSTSYTNFSINSIEIDNQSISIDETRMDRYDPIPFYVCLSSIEVPISSYLINSSFYIRKSDIVTGTLSIWIYNSTWDGSKSVPDGGIDTSIDVTADTGVLGSWKDATLNYFLNNSNTQNNTWFVGLMDDGGVDVNSEWNFDYDGVSGDNVDNSLCYEYAGGGNWDLINLGETIDFNMKIGLGLPTNLVSPSNIHLKINSTNVQDDLSANSGTWYSNLSFQGINNELNFVLSSGWYNFRCNITAIQINYTKTFSANTSYTVESGVNVYWDSEANFTAFDHRLDNNTVTFTIPFSWTNLNLDRDGTPITPSTATNSTNQILTVFGMDDAIDGNWTLASQSTNMISSVKAGIGGKEVSLAYSNDTVSFNATLANSISGNVNLSVYNPSDLNNNLNYTTLAVPVGTSVDFGNWVVSQNISDYGLFRIQATWENSTDVGIYDTTLFIAAATVFDVPTINNTEYLNSDSKFNVSIIYEDTLLTENITGATLTYDLGLGGGPVSDTTQTNADNSYNLTIDPSLYAVGFHEIPITISKPKYMNYTFSFGFYIVNNTQIYEYTGASTLDVIRGKNATFIFNYNQTWLNTPITGAIITDSNVDPGFVWSYIEEGGATGNYTIHLNTSLLDVGPYNCEFTISQTNYKTQTFSFNININIAQTEINLINHTTTVKRISDLNFTTYIQIKDTDNNLNILGISSSALTVYDITAVKTVWDTDENPDWSLWEVGNGIYGVNVSLGSTGGNRIDSGNYTLQLNISYSPNYNWSTLDLSFYIEGNTTVINILQINDGTSTDYTGTIIPAINGNYSIFQNPVASVEFALQFDFIDVDAGNAEINLVSVEYWAILLSIQDLDTSVYFEYSPVNLYHRGRLVLPSSLSIGDYQIELIVGLQNYENASIILNLTIKALNTTILFDSIIQTGAGSANHTNPVYEATNNTYFVYSKYDLQLDFRYRDIINAQNILLAEYAVLSYNGQNISYTGMNGDDYRWILTSNNLVSGSYNITIYFGKTDYVNASYSFNLTILWLPTAAAEQFDITQPSLNSSTLTGTPYMVYRPYGLVVNASYRDTNNSIYLEGAYAVLNYNGVNYTSIFYGNDMYGWVVPVEALVTGSKTITLYFGLENYLNVSESFDINVIYNPTDVNFENILQPDHLNYETDTLPYNSLFQNYSAYTAYDISILLYFNNTVNSSEIAGASVSLLFDSTYYPASSYENNFYNWILPIADLSVGTFNLTFSFNKTYFLNRTYSFNVSLYDLPTSVADTFQILQPDHNATLLLNVPYPIYTAYNMVVNSSYIDTNNSDSFISGAIAQLYIDESLVSTTNYENAGMYGWSINISSYALGQHKIWVNFSKEDYVSGGFEFYILVNHTQTEASLYDITQNEHPGYETDTLIKGDPPLNNYTVYMLYGLELNVSYTDPTNGSNPILFADATFNLDGLILPMVYSGGYYSIYVTPAQLQSHAGESVPVIINMNNTWHYNQTLRFNLTIVVLPTSAADLFEIYQTEHNASLLTGNPYVAYMPYSIQVYCSYYDLNNTEYIANASDVYAILAYNSKNYTIESYGSNLYGWVIPIADLIEGSPQNVAVYFGKPNYANSSHTFSLSLSILPTVEALESIRQPDHIGFATDEVNPDPIYSSYIIYRAYNLRMDFSFVDPTNSNEMITDADIGFIYNGIPYNLTYAGGYSVLIPSDSLVFGSEIITVLFNRSGMETQFILMNITVINLETSALEDFEIYQTDHNSSLLTGDPYIAYMPFSIQIYCSYYDLNNSEYIANDSDVYAILAYNGKNYTIQSYGSDLYGWIIPIADLVEAPSQNIAIYFGKPNYDNATYAVSISLSLLPTVENLSSIRQPDHGLYGTDEVNPDPIYSSYIIYRAYDLRMEFTFVDPTNTNEIIIDADIGFIYNGNPYNFTYAAGYSVLIPSESLVFGSEIISVRFNRSGMETQIISLNITVIPIPTELRNQVISQPGRTPVYVNVTAGYIIYDAFDLILNASYYDLNNSAYIQGTWSYVTLDGDLYVSNFFQNDRFGWVISASNLNPGIYDLEINLGLENFANATETIRITIQVLTTNLLFNENEEDNDLRQPFRPNYLTNPVLEINNVYHVFIHYSVVIDVIYFNEVDEHNLDAADYALLTYNGFTATPTEISAGKYRFTIPAINLTLGPGTVLLEFGKITFENASRNILLDVHELNTTLDSTGLSQPDHQGIIQQDLVGSAIYDIYLSFDTLFELTFTDVNNSLPISSGVISTFDFNGTIIPLAFQVNGHFIWNISSNYLNFGIHSVSILLTSPDYESQLFEFILNVSYIQTEANMLSIQQDGEDLPFNDENLQYFAYSPFDIQITYTFYDMVLNTSIINPLFASLQFGQDSNLSGQYQSGQYIFEILATDLEVGVLNFNITFAKYGYENITVEFSIEIVEEYSIEILLVDSPDRIVQGDTLPLVFKVTYDNGVNLLPLVGATIILQTNNPDISAISNQTDASGNVYFAFVLPNGEYTELNITLEYDGVQYGIAGGNNLFSLQVERAEIIPMWVVYLVLGFVGFIAIAVTVQKRIIEPRRMHFTDMVMSSATVFEDAINIQHVMIIFKSWGTSIFFKSFAEETLDPDLISGFLSAVQSFGKELKSQKALNELSYGDKILLFSDGEFIRVTLVLSKSASPYLKRNLSTFVSVFEVQYKEQLEKWNGQLNVFKDSEDLIDEVLKTSVILPHRFNPDAKKPKEIRSLTKQVQAIAESLIGEDRPFLFLAQVLQQAIDETGKEAPEIILSITELLDQKILIPIKIEHISKEELTETQKGELHARVWQIPNKTNGEKEEIYTQLLDLSEAEREVALSSMLQVVTITSEYTKEEYEIPKFNKEKDAKSEIKKLMNQAKKSMKEKEFDEALKFYEFAEIIAIQWNLKDIAKEIESTVLGTTEEKLRYTIKTSKKEGKRYKKAKEYEHAMNAYQNALDAAHHLFQLGFEDVEDEIKELTHQVMENKQECKEDMSNSDCITADRLIQTRKELLHTYTKKSKQLEYGQKVEILSKISVISNLLFKFGNSSEIKTIKQYQKKMDGLKKDLKKESPEYQETYTAKMNELQELASNLERLRKEEELNANWLEAIFLYQKRLNIAYLLGNVDRAVYLVGQIRVKLSKIPYIYTLIDEYKQKIIFAKEQGNQADEMQYQEKLNLLHDIIFIFD